MKLIKGMSWQSFTCNRTSIPMIKRFIEDVVLPFNGQNSSNFQLWNSSHYINLICFTNINYDYTKRIVFTRLCRIYCKQNSGNWKLHSCYSNSPVNPCPFLSFPEPCGLCKQLGDGNFVKLEQGHLRSSN